MIKKRRSLQSPKKRSLKIIWPKVKSKLYKAIRLHKFTKLKQSQKEDIVFHLWDCYPDINLLADFYRHPDKYTASKVKEILNGLSIHAINHLAAAVKIFRGDPLVDIFDVGLFDVFSKKMQHKHCPKQPQDI